MTSANLFSNLSPSNSLPSNNLSQDLYLTSGHDLLVENFDLVLTINENAVAQRVKQALLLFKGEWFLDTDIGIPYYDSILGQKHSIDGVKSLYIAHIKKVEGVKEIIEFNIEFNDAARAITINFRFSDILNNSIEVSI